MTSSPRRLAAPALALAIVVAGCAGSGAAPTDPPSAPSASPTAAPTAVPSPAATLAPGATPAPSAVPSLDPAAAARAVLEGKAWASTTLTDVATGQPFRIADHAGRTIFVESMAIWCSNCRAQQARFRDALARLDPAEVAYVVLTVDPGETGEALARYKDQQGFTGTYAVAGREVAGALAAEFGPNAINPPSVPLVIVRPDGTVEFRTGSTSVDEIVATVRG